MKLIHNTALAALGAFAAMMAAGCATESPFEEGQGTLRLRMVVNSEVTRAENTQQELAEKCVVYISDSKGLLYKYHGLDNLPSTLPLRTGGYVAEAWTGDSVSASFDKKFYRGYQPFTITRGGVESVVLNCRIANVVASVNPADNVTDKIRNWTVTIANSRGSLDFNADNVATARGYFMMPNADNALVWTIAGENADGRPFTKQGRIENVKRAHEYILNLTYNPTVGGDDTGGGFITVTVNDEELLIEDEVTLHAAPVFEGEGFDINTAAAAPRGGFTDKVVRTYAYRAFSAYRVRVPAELGLPSTSFNLLDLTDQAAEALRAAGLQWSFREKPELEQTNAMVTFSSSLLNRLPDGEYRVEFEAVDADGRTRSLSWRINVSDAAVEPQPVLPEETRSYSVTLRGTIVKDDVANPGFEYRAKGTSAWTHIPGTPVTRASQEFMARLTGLSPATTYEYRVVADGFVGPLVRTFTTESIFVIPNAGMEEWSTNSKGAYIPGLGGNPSFWDTGNHGSITMNKNITTPGADIFHGGATSARLASQFVGIGSIGKFAAGNIFAGTYDGTEGTDGKLTFGRPFDGSHPVRLRGWANYRPATVQYAGGGVAKGDMDQGQLYVALATKSFQIRTKTKEFFNPDDPAVLAYGEITWTGDFAPDGQMARFEIEIVPRAGYLAARPAYLILVASASRYGDYFAGGNSILYLDDLELVYE